MTIKELWQSFALKCMSPNTPPGHKQDLKLAFWCGASGMFQLLMSIPDEEMGEQLFKDWEAEIMAFFDKIRKEMQPR